MTQSAAKSVAFGLAAIALLSILLGISKIPLLEPDEGRNARVAQEILGSRDWVLPHFHGMPYLDKPILYFAAVASSLAIFGSNEAAARLPSIFFAIATGLATWLLARRLHSREIAWASIAVLASSPLFLLFSRTVIFDIALTCLITFALWFAIEGRGGRRWGFPLFWVCTGLAVLTKGPVGLLLPLLGGALILIGLGRPWGFRGLFHPVGIALFFATCLPWALSMEARQPGFLRYALLVETVERLTKPTFQRTGPFYYYVPILLLGLLPWSIVALGRLPGWVRRWRSLRTPSPQRGLLFVVVAIVAFFSASSSKLGGYVLPVVPLIAVLMGREVVLCCWVGGRLQSAHSAAPFADPRPSGNLSSAAPSATPPSSANLRGADPLADPRSTGEAQHSAGNSAGPRANATRAWTLVPGIVLFTLGAALLVASRAGLPLDRWMKQPPALSGAAGDLLAGIGIVFAVCGLGLFVLHRMRRSAGAPMVLGLVAPLMLIAAIPPMVRYADQNSSRQLAAELRRLGAETQAVATVQCFPTSLDFYMGRVVPVVTETGREITSTYVARNHDALKAAGAPGLWSPQDLDAALRAGSVGILITRSDIPPGPAFRLASRIRKYRIWAREGFAPPPR